MHQHEEGNLPLDAVTRLQGLRFDQRGAELAVETREILRDGQAILRVECGLKVPQHQQRVIDFAGARLDIVALAGHHGAPQVFDDLLVEQNHQTHGTGAPYGHFAIRQLRIHRLQIPDELIANRFISHRPEVSVGAVALELLPPPEPSVPSVAVTSCSSSGYACSEALTRLYWLVSCVCSASSWVSKFWMLLVKSCCWALFCLRSTARGPVVRSVR